MRTVAGYIAKAPKEARTKLRAMRACVKKAAPGAKESLKWSMPAISFRRILVMYAGFKKHIGFYPSPEAITKFSKELSRFTSGKGSVQFPLDKPLPLPLIRKMTRFRMKHLMKKDTK